MKPTDKNFNSMWELMEELFPIYRSLVGPGFCESLETIQKRLPITISEFPSGSKVFDWTIPKEFKVNSSYVIDPNGNRIMDYDKCSYHVWVYSQPFHGEMDRDELLQHVSTHSVLPDAVPLRVTYYREKWGLCASQKQVNAMPEGRYQVHIDTEHFDGFLRIGEYFLPGETNEEILITSYLCHPRGANDNLSGVVIATELFKLLKKMPNRRYSYRLALWPETIGAITYIFNYPERLKKTIGGYVLLCLGVSSDDQYYYSCSYEKKSIFDRAMVHSLKSLGYEYTLLENSTLHSDERHFNGSGLRMPFGALMSSRPGAFDAYHTSFDDLSCVKPDALYQSLKSYWKAIMAIERNRFYKGNFTVEPFLTEHGIFPFDLGVGEGTTMAKNIEFRDRARAFYSLMWNADGETDLLEIAEKAGYDIEYFERPVKDFLRAGLIEMVSQSSR